MLSVRATFIAAGSCTSISVTVVRCGGDGKIARTAPPPPEITISRPPRSSSCAPKACGPRSSEPASRGPPAARGSRPRLACGEGDRVEPRPRDREHGLAVRLDDVGLVDALLLVVRRRER